MFNVHVDSSNSSSTLPLTPPLPSHSLRTLVVQLAVDTVTLQRTSGSGITVPFDKERVISLLRHQVRGCIDKSVT